MRSSSTGHGSPGYSIPSHESGRTDLTHGPPVRAVARGVGNCCANCIMYNNQFILILTIIHLLTSHGLYRVAHGIRQVLLTRRYSTLSARVRNRNLSRSWKRSERGPNGKPAGGDTGGRGLVPG